MRELEHLQKTPEISKLFDLHNYDFSSEIEFMLELAMKADMSPCDLDEIAKDNDYFVYIQSSDEEFVQNITSMIEDLYFNNAIRIFTLIVNSLDKAPKISVLGLGLF